MQHKLSIEKKHCNYKKHIRANMNKRTKY